ncbi:MAG TPA: class I SAM-dependent methyltransferase [Ktedonobacteraceae bacterium]|nr:class I SAM-dependent methyltransferase [Ktedonobacteraceae bacterium]
MESSGTEEIKQFTFEPFAAHPFYTAVNRSLVQQALAPLISRPPDAPLTIVDLACGTGAITRLIAEEVLRSAHSMHLIAVDPSPKALQQAQKQMEQVAVPVKFFQGEAADLSRLVSAADAVFFCNAIHLLSDKGAAFHDIAAVLAPGGIFACNSAFYEGTSTDETLRFGRLWIRRAVGWLRKEHPDVLFAREAKAMALQWLSSDGYTHLLQESGFVRVKITQERVMMSLDGLRDLGQYQLFIEGALPGVPLVWAAAALGVAVYQAGKELEMTEIPRLWLQIIAAKGSSETGSFSCLPV